MYDLQHAPLIRCSLNVFLNGVIPAEKDKARYERLLAGPLDEWGTKFAGTHRLQYMRIGDAIADFIAFVPSEVWSVVDEMHHIYHAEIKVETELVFGNYSPDFSLSPDLLDFFDRHHMSIDFDMYPGRDTFSEPRYPSSGRKPFPLFYV